MTNLFFDKINNHVSQLNDNERKIFDFIIKNMNEVQNYSMRKLAKINFVSPATLLRLIRKLGFDGYDEFSSALKVAILQNNVAQTKIPQIILNNKYDAEYLKNIVESLRVLQNNQLDDIVNDLNTAKTVYFFAKDECKYLTEYVYHSYVAANINVVFPKDSNYRSISADKVTDGDLVFVFSYDGDDTELIGIINKIQQNNLKVRIVSITQADNNTIQNLSNNNLYMFADKLTVNDINITSVVSMAAIMELILYRYLRSFSKNK